MLVRNLRQQVSEVPHQSDSYRDYSIGVREYYRGDSLPLSATHAHKKGYEDSRKRSLVLDQQIALMRLCREHSLPCTPLAVKYLQGKQSDLSTLHYVGAELKGKR